MKSRKSGRYCIGSKPRAGERLMRGSIGCGASARHGPDGSSPTGTDGVLPAMARCVFIARFILFGLVLAQLGDALTFTIGVSTFGIGLESNGIASMLYKTSGLDGVLMAKAAVLLATIGLL